jgi:hypothetical protein
MDGVLRTFGRDWKCSAVCGLSVHSNLFVLMCAKCYWFVYAVFVRYRTGVLN